MKKRLTPLKSIRKYCVRSCMSGSPKEVRFCPSCDCTLYSYRFGRYPAGSRKKRVFTEEQKQQLIKQLN